MGRVLVAAVVVAVILGIAGAAYQVFETEQVILTQLGKPVGKPVTEPGLHFKIPLIRKVHRFDRRFLEWDGKANQLPTKDKRFIWADTYARWRITDPLLFFQRLQNERGAQSRLDDILDGETRNAIANHELVELVRTSNRTPVHDESLSEGSSDELAPIKDGREQIRQEILAAAQTRTQDLGIEILDVQFKRINYVEEVQEKVYDRMIAERRRIADRFRSEGEGESARIRGELERDLQQIESEAFKTAEEIKGQADAEATSIYAAAYDRSVDSRRFYEFLKSMETLEQTADSETSILLSTEGEFYRFLKESGSR
jgi:membrane protease subunit HflC